MLFGSSSAPNPYKPVYTGPPLAPFHKRLARHSHILLPWFFVALVGAAASLAESDHARSTALLARQTRTLSRMIDELREERSNVSWVGQARSGSSSRLTEEEIERRLMMVGLRERPAMDGVDAKKLGEEQQHQFEKEFAWEEEGVKRSFWDRLTKGKSEGEKKAEELESQASFNEWMASINNPDAPPTTSEPKRVLPGWSEPYRPAQPQTSSSLPPSQLASSTSTPLPSSSPSPISKPSAPASFDVIPNRDSSSNERTSYEQKRAWAAKAFM